MKKITIFVFASLVLNTAAFAAVGPQDAIKSKCADIKQKLTEKAKQTQNAATATDEAKPGNARDAN